MISRSELRAYCLSLKAAEETFPFDATTCVFKVMGKMFALVPTDNPEGELPSISLKCDPALAEILRQTYPAVKPGYHLNKKHWNTVTMDGTIPKEEIFEMIDNSYHLVVQSLKKSDQKRLSNDD